MRIRQRLPKVVQTEWAEPEGCPAEDCQGKYFKVHQRQCTKQLLDPDHGRVTARRYQCMSCKRTFRVYPRGVSRAQRSDRLKGIGIMFYVLGLSYGGVEDALAALGWAGSKSSTYRDVRGAGEAVQRIQQAQGAR